MASNDVKQDSNVLTVEIFNAGIAELRTEIGALKNEITDVKTNVAVNSAKIEMLQSSINWGFAIMAIVVAFVAIFTPFFKREKIEKKEPELTVAKVQSMIDEALARAMPSMMKPV